MRPFYLQTIKSNPVSLNISSYSIYKVFTKLFLIASYKARHAFIIFLLYFRRRHFNSCQKATINFSPWIKSNHKKRPQKCKHSHPSVGNLFGLIYVFRNSESGGRVRRQLSVTNRHWRETQEHTILFLFNTIERLRNNEIAVMWIGEQMADEWAPLPSRSARDPKIETTKYNAPPATLVGGWHSRASSAHVPRASRASRASRATRGHATSTIFQLTSKKRRLSIWILVLFKNIPNHCTYRFKHINCAHKCLE